MTDSRQENSARLTEEMLQDIADRLRTIEIPAERARDYEQADSRRGYFFGLANLNANIETADPDAGPIPRSMMTEATDKSVFDISVVDNPPNLVHLASALKPAIKSRYALLGHLAPRISHELFIGESLAPSMQAAFNLGHRVLYMLRIKTGALCRVIGVSQTSWNQIAAKKDSVFAQVLETENLPKWNDHEVTIRADDLHWCIANLVRVFDLYDSPPFRLAFDSAGQSPFLGDIRTSIARTWAGIEALFDVQQELSYRLSMYAAVLVADSLHERIAFQGRFKSLYGKRSKAVHGSHMSREELKSTAYESWRLLCELVNACIRTSDEIVPPKTLDRVLLGEALVRDSPS